MKDLKKKAFSNTNYMFRAFAVKIDPDPNCFRNRRQTLTGVYSKQWCGAEKSEYDSHIVNKTWILVGKSDFNEFVHILSGK